jgi:phosphoserine phosphatase
VPLLPLFALRGRARFKELVSRQVEIDPATLPYRRDVLEFVSAERSNGRRVVLATAANRRIADAVARHLAMFDDVIASDGAHNAKGDGKVESIRARIGSSEFDYVGDSMADVPVFRIARRSYLVCPDRSLEAAVRDGCHVAGVFTGQISRSGTR